MAKMKRTINKPIVTVDQTITEFLQFKSKSIKETSIRSYSEQLKIISKAIGCESIFSINQDTKQKVIDYMNLNLNYNIISSNSSKRVFNLYLKWLNQTYNTELIKFEYQKEPKYIKPQLSDKDIKKLLMKPNLSISHYSTYRNWVIINLILCTGIRANTAVNILIEDVNFQEKTIRLTEQKNGIPMVFPLNDKMINILHEYLNRCELSTQYLFEGMVQTRLTSKMLSMSYARYCQNRGVNVTSIHALRHYFASQLMKRTQNIYLVKESLNHSSIAITERYLKSIGVSSYEKELRNLDLI